VPDLWLEIVGSRFVGLAIDYQPGDWVPVPPDTGVLMGYYEFGTRNEYNNTITGTAKSNTHLDSTLGLHVICITMKSIIIHTFLISLCRLVALTHGENQRQESG